MFLPGPWDNGLVELFHHACVINVAIILKVHINISVQ